VIRVQADARWTKRMKRVPPLPRKPIITRTRCNLMRPSPAWDQSVFKQILAAHWEAFPRAHPRYQASSFDDLVAKRLARGNPDQMG
jgi:hypothetical protein